MIVGRPHAIGDLGCHVHQDHLVDLVPGLGKNYKRNDPEDIIKYCGYDAEDDCDIVKMKQESIAK